MQVDNFWYVLSVNVNVRAMTPQGKEKKQWISAGVEVTNGVWAGIQKVVGSNATVTHHSHLPHPSLWDCGPDSVTLTTHHNSLIS